MRQRERHPGWHVSIAQRVLGAGLDKLGAPARALARPRPSLIARPAKREALCLLVDRDCSQQQAVEMLASVCAAGASRRRPAFGLLGPDRTPPCRELRAARARPRLAKRRGLRAVRLRLRCA